MGCCQIAEKPDSRFGLRAIQLFALAVQQRTAAAIARDNMGAERANRRMDRGQIFGFVTGLTCVVAAVCLGVAQYLAEPHKLSWPTAVLGIIIVAIGIGGPNVARLIADQLWAQLWGRGPRR
jgi:hypothetical protein